MDELDDMCPIYDRPDFVEINVNNFKFMVSGQVGRLLIAINTRSSRKSRYLGVN